MRQFIKILLLSAGVALFLGTGLVSYSDETECPEMEQGSVGESAFFSAHGITQENFSIWLREHSEWRRKYSDELKNYTFIPEGDFDTRRK